MESATKKNIKIYAALIFFVLLCAGYSYFIEPNRLVVAQQEVKIKNWNAEFENLKIAMISDVHGGSNNVTEQKIRDVVTLTNAQNPDITVLLGDYISEDPNNLGKLKMPLETVVENLKGLKAAYGVYVILGNHEGLYRAQTTAAFEKIGYKVLQNEVAVIEKNNQRIRILGYADHLTFKSWQEVQDKSILALSQTDQRGDIIALEHSPDIIQTITGSFAFMPDLKLILAGHTHGGQVRLPIIGTPFIPSSYGQKYAYGHIRENNVDMFVTSGIGTSLLPVRFLVPPEIMFVTVSREVEN